MILMLFVIDLTLQLESMVLNLEQFQGFACWGYHLVSEQFFCTNIFLFVFLFSFTTFLVFFIIFSTWISIGIVFSNYMLQHFGNHIFLYV